jgi:hypothetical protein
MLKSSLCVARAVNNRKVVNGIYIHKNDSATRLSSLWYSLVLGKKGKVWAQKKTTEKSTHEADCENK